MAKPKNFGMTATRKEVPFEHLRKQTPEIEIKVSILVLMCHLMVEEKSLENDSSSRMQDPA